MQIIASTYIPGRSFVHRADARVKLVLLLGYSVSLFFVRSWWGLGLAALVCAALCASAHLRARRLAKLLIPMYAILAFTLVFNSFTFDAAHIAAPVGIGDVSMGVFAGAAPVPLWGPLCFVPTGFARGAYYAVRIVLLVLASFVVSFTTTSTALTGALGDFLKPLRVFRVPTHDIATTVSIALRFIPITAEELGRLLAAQWVRGAAFSDGPPLRRLRAWQTVLIPLFVGLFRRADSLALAMETRCYGMGEAPTQLNPRPFTPLSAAVLALGLAGCIAAALLL